MEGAGGVAPPALATKHLQSERQHRSETDEGIVNEHGARGRCVQG